VKSSKVQIKGKPSATSAKAKKPTSTVKSTSKVVAKPKVPVPAKTSAVAQPKAIKAKVKPKVVPAVGKGKK